MVNIMTSFFQEKLTKEQIRDSGVAATILVLLISFFDKEHDWSAVGILLLFLVSLFPQVFKPFAMLWFALSKVIGHVMAVFICGVVFFGVLTFLALVRRALGHDVLSLKRRPTENESVFKTRNHVFTNQDMKRSF